MHIVVYAVTVSIFLFCGLMGLSAVLEPVEGIPHMRMGMPAKSVPTTTGEMAARARETALMVEADFKRRNPPQPITASAPAVVAKPALKAVAADHSARKKKVRVARDGHGPAEALAYVPRTALSFHGGLD